MGVAGHLSAAEHTDRSVQLFRGAVVRAYARSWAGCLLPQFPLASGPVLAPQPWDFPSLLPGAVTHKTQGVCPESPFFKPGLGAQSLWGQRSPNQLIVSCAAPLILCLFPSDGSSQMNVSNTEDRGWPCTGPLVREGRRTAHSQPAFSLGIWEQHQPGLEELLA